mmetsp:Transcript_22841/g.50299  ORF Transcript_22841/g.50299 Transcript_22841/m.50299 type:complete len:767 (-) Transcript_22841:108-2408(-)
MDVEFELSQQLKGHDGDECQVRSVAVLGDGSIATGGSRCDVVIWKRPNPEASKFELFRKVNHHSGAVLAISPSAAQPGAFFTGSHDKTAAHTDASGVTTVHFVGHGGPVCSVEQRGSQLVTGSWDGTAKVWDISNGTEVQTLKAGKNAIVVAVLGSGDIATGSQDGCLSLFKGSDVAWKKENAHLEKINAILVTPTGLLTASHDSNVKMWSFDGYELASFCGHNNFVYDVKLSMDKKNLYSVADDCTLKVWNFENNTCKQSLVHAAAVWQVAVLENEDVVSVCSDSTVRIWSMDPHRFAAESERQAQKEMATHAMFKPLKNGSCSVPTEQTFDQIMEIDAMAAFEGQMTGEVKCFKDGDDIVGCQWNSKTKAWDKMASFKYGAEEQAAEKQWYIGDQYFPFGQYDYVFNVDMSEAGKPAGESKALPYNKGQNPMEVAETFCTREGIHRSYVEQVRQFIIQNAGGAAAAAAAAGNSSSTQSSSSKPAPPPEPTLAVFPVLEVCAFKDGKFEPLQNKVLEFNAQVPEAQRLEALECQHFQDAIGKLKLGVSSEFRPCEKEVVWRKLKEWPQDKIFPVIDLWRLFLNHPSSADVFKGSDRGTPYLVQVLQLFQSDPSGPLGLCCARFLSNMFIYQTNKYAAFDKRDLILKALEPALVQGSKHVKIAAASVLLNLAEVLYESSQPPKPWDAACAEVVARLALDFLSKAGSEDVDAVKRSVLAIGTLLVRDKKHEGQVAARCKEANFLAKVQGLESMLGGSTVSDFKSLLA